jgi:hypothetical protein
LDFGGREFLSVSRKTSALLLQQNSRFPTIEPAAVRTESEETLARIYGFSACTRDSSLRAPARALPAVRDNTRRHLGTTASHHSGALDLDESCRRRMHGQSDRPCLQLCTALALSRARLTHLTTLPRRRPPFSRSCNAVGI